MILLTSKGILMYQKLTIMATGLKTRITHTCIRRHALRIHVFWSKIISWIAIDFCHSNNGSVCQKKNGKGGASTNGTRNRIQSADSFSLALTHDSSVVALQRKYARPFLWKEKQDICFSMNWLAQASSKGRYRRWHKKTKFSQNRFDLILCILYVLSTRHGVCKNFSSAQALLLVIALHTMHLQNYLSD